MAKKQLDMGRAWKDATGLFAGNLDMALAIGGVFLLLPALLLGWFGTPLKAENVESFAVLRDLLSQFLQANWHLLLIDFVLTSIGAIALYRLVLNPGRPTVSEALIASVTFFPCYFLAQLVGGVMFAFGFFLLIIPGIYVWIKLVLVGPSIAAENIGSPLAALRRSWALTKNNSVLIFLFVLMIALTGILVMAGLELAINVPIALLLSADTAKPVNLLVSATLQVGFSIFLMFIMMAIYRQMSANLSAE